jgi:hypothetical protein
MRIRLRRHFRIAAPAGVQLDPATAELVRLAALLEVVLRAVDLQDEADAVIHGCALPGETPCEVARRGRQVAGEYGRLCGWAEDLSLVYSPGSVPRRIGGLLRYHLEMLDVALKLAFPRYRSAKLERRRLALTGLGEPARALRDRDGAPVADRRIGTPIGSSDIEGQNSYSTPVRSVETSHSRRAASGSVACPRGFSRTG